MKNLEENLEEFYAELALEMEQELNAMFEEGAEEAENNLIELIESGMDPIEAYALAEICPVSEESYNSLADDARLIALEERTYYGIHIIDIKIDL